MNVGKPPYHWKAANGPPINTFETKRPPARVIVQAPNFQQKRRKVYHVNLNKVFLLHILYYKRGNILTLTISTFIIQNIYKIFIVSYPKRQTKI